jgi:hypothetical protein
MSSATLIRPPGNAGDGDDLRLWDDAALTPARGPSEAAPRPATPHDVPAGEEPGRAVRGAPTLEDLISGAWEGLSAHASVACPACGAEMHPRAGAGPEVLGGRCTGCGSELT